MNLKDSDRKLLQRIFLKHNLLSEEHYEEILEIYEKNRANFINRIIFQGYVKTPRFFPILAKELSLEYCSCQRLFKNREKAKLYPYRFLKRYLVFPLEESPTTLTFATANPFDNEFLTYIKKSFKDSQSSQPHILLCIRRLRVRYEKSGRYGQSFCPEET